MLLFILANSAVATFFTMRNANFHQDSFSSLIEARLRTNTSTVLVWDHFSHRVIGTLMVPTEIPSNGVVTLVVRQMIDCPPPATIPSVLTVTATCLPGTSVVASQTSIFMTLTSTVNDPLVTTPRSPTPTFAPPTLTFAPPTLTSTENPQVVTTFPRSPTSVVAPSVFTTVTNPPVTSTFQNPISPTLPSIPVIFSTTSVSTPSSVQSTYLLTTS